MFGNLCIPLKLVVAKDDATRHLGGCHTPPRRLILGSSTQRTQGGAVRNPVYCKGLVMIHGQRGIPSTKLSQAYFAARVAFH